MNRVLRVTVAAGMMAAVMAGVTYAANRPVPANEAEKVIQNVTGTALPGDANALHQALMGIGPVKYKILVVDTIEGEDRTAYLDRVAAEWGQPGADTLLLVIYGDGNYDIRFYMGGIFVKQGVSVDEMLGLVRTKYLPKARNGNASGGLADLVEAVNQRLGSGTAAGQ